MEFIVFISLLCLGAIFLIHVFGPDDSPGSTPADADSTEGALNRFDAPGYPESTGSIRFINSPDDSVDDWYDADLYGPRSFDPSDPFSF